MVGGVEVAEGRRGRGRGLRGEGRPHTSIFPDLRGGKARGGGEHEWRGQEIEATQIFQYPMSRRGGHGEACEVLGASLLFTHV